MAHTELDDSELDEVEVEETSMPVGATSSESFRLEHKEIKPLKQNLTCGFCKTPFSKVPKKGYLYPHTKMEDEADGRNACEKCHPVELAAAIAAGLIVPVVMISEPKRRGRGKTNNELDIMEPEQPKRKRGRPRKVVVESIA